MVLRHRKDRPDKCSYELSTRRDQKEDHKRLDVWHSHKIYELRSNMDMCKESG